MERHPSGEPQTGRWAWPQSVLIFTFCAYENSSLCEFNFCTVSAVEIVLRRIKILLQERSWLFWRYCCGFGRKYWGKFRDTGVGIGRIPFGCSLSTLSDVFL